MHVKNLHAYWRMEYVEIPQSQKSEKNDPFLNVADDDDPSSLVIFKSDFCYAILNKFPYNAGHAMVIPYRQVDDLQKLFSSSLWKKMEAKGYDSDTIMIWHFSLLQATQEWLSRALLH